MLDKIKEKSSYIFCVLLILLPIIVVVYSFFNENIKGKDGKVYLVSSYNTILVKDK